LPFRRKHSWFKPLVQTRPAIQMSALRYDWFRNGFQANVAAKA
jgi:hypothetical protein